MVVMQEGSIILNYAAAISTKRPSCAGRPNRFAPERKFTRCMKRADLAFLCNAGLAHSG